MPRLSGRSRKETRADAPKRRTKPASPALRWALRAGAIGLALSLVVGASVLAWTTGWAERRWTEVETAAIEATRRAGFSVEEVLVIGRRATAPTDLLLALGVNRGDPILVFDPVQAREAILALPWVRDVTVRRQLPDTIIVRITERRPLALWQNQHRLRLIDRRGVVLAVGDLRPFVDLPLVIGEGAPAQFPALQAVLAEVPALAERVTASIRVGARRWDLHLDNGVRVHLPETGFAPMLHRLAELERDSGVIDRDVRSIDLRLGDRVVIRASPLANERRRLPEENT